jgi:hypothetical protein
MAKRYNPNALPGVRQLLQNYIPPTDLIGLYPYKEHPWTAQKFVSDLERRTGLGARRWLEDNNWYPLVAAFSEDNALAQGVHLPADQVARHHVTMTVQEVAVHELWDRTRYVMDIHPGMIPFLESSGSDKFPPMVLKNLPYPNPLVFLGEPVEFTGAAGETLRLLGWYVAGMSGHHQYVDTTDERATSFHLTAISEVMSDDGKQVMDWDYCRITLPITGKDATMDELIKQGLARFNWDPTIAGQTDASQRRYMSELLHVLVPHMLYLVSQNLETKPKPFNTAPQPKRNKWDKKQGGGKVFRQLVGFETGPVLASPEHWGGEMVEPRGERGPQGSKRSPRAHWRRGHFHSFWAGEGLRKMSPEEREERAEKRVKWLPPMPINADNKPEVGKVTQAVKVR